VTHAPEDEWRLTDQEDYLQGITLVRRTYRQWSETWDHDHCQFCWAKFMPRGVEPPEGDEEPIHREGYTNVDVTGQQDHYWWICEECFEDFADRFAWTVRPSPPGES
jgi:hypothetical protein